MQQLDTTPALPPEQPASPTKPVCNRCGKELQSNNKSGYCQLHNHIGRRRPRPKCNRPDCTKKLHSNNTTGYCKKHWRQLREAKLKKAPQIYGEELEARRADDRWELHNDETGTVACRICGKRMERLGPKGKPGHLLREHGLTVPQYRQHCQSKGWGVPPITSLRSQEAIAKWRRDHPEKIKALQIRKNAKDKVRRATEPEFRKHEGDQIRKLAQSKLTDADKKVRVQCLVPKSSGLPCGEWYRSLGAHLWAVHNMSFAAYSLACPGAPTEATDLVGQETKVGKVSKKMWADRNQRMLPADLGSQPETWQKTVPVLIANRLLGKTLGNREALKLAGVKVEVSKQTMNRMRDYCHVPGPKGRPRKSL